MKITIIAFVCLLISGCDRLGGGCSEFGDDFHPPGTGDYEGTCWRVSRSESGACSVAAVNPKRMIYSVSPVFKFGPGVRFIQPVNFEGRNVVRSDVVVGIGSREFVIPAGDSRSAGGMDASARVFDLIDIADTMTMRVPDELERLTETFTLTGLHAAIAECKREFNR